ncbi:Ectopic P granules protein 5 homolog [Nesidiocoris tenuis]|uniref:Ectopic P granules protein 5 homolog n=1 Tax=Nesidiocoris tenuis TaxID=355587 RepID=A0ABN7ASR5_9HEMI|nr:Ectopic P granules protein 5 homolog [Nesidiocoris tenuis]
MEAIPTKTKKRKPKTKSQEETIALIGGPAEVACSDDDILLSPLSPHYGDSGVSPEEKEPLISAESALHDVENPVQDVVCSAPEAPPEDELSAGVSHLAIAPELDLLSTNFDQYIREEGEPVDPSLSLQSDFDGSRNAQKSLLGCSNIEDEYTEVLEAVSKTPELQPFAEGQLLPLYHNTEIEQAQILVENFLEDELRSGSVQRHPLYELLQRYLKSRDKLNANVVEIETLIKETKEIQQRLWILETVKVTEAGECQDGNPVEASHQYQVGTLDELVLSKLAKNLAIIRDKANEQHALHSYSCLTTKLQIENFVRKLNAIHSNLPHNAPVSLCEVPVPRTPELRGAISVLFYFLRQPNKDQGFVADCVNWLHNIVATLLRISSWQDHMFLLNHVFRCPGGVSKWATGYIQAPAPPFDASNINIYLDHMISVISIIVSPIKDRDMFLAQLEKSMDDSEETWVMVDSEGEDEGSGASSLHLRENDIIAFFNQIPLDCLFSLSFGLQRRDNAYVLTRISSGQMLRTIAITRQLIKIFGHGINTYIDSKYQQFAKRLASTIVNTVQFMTDIWEAFRKHYVDVNDASLIDRLQVEYDSVVKSACSALISSQQKSVLQFLITLPFGSASLPTVWHLLQTIIQPVSTSAADECAADWWEGVEELLCSLNGAESCYVLTALCNMALSRPPEDWCFHKLVTALLLQIGFINNSTKDACHKTVRTQLSNITNVYPALISLVMHKLKHFIPQAGNLSLYLFRELPLHLWKPQKEDIELLEHWLLACPQGSIESSLAIFILHCMNWGIHPNCPSQLFLPREIHCQVALLVVRLAILHCPESPSSSHSTVIADTIKQLTSSSAKLITEQTLNVWIWSMLFKLRLHLLDQPESAVGATLANPLQFFSILPSLESLPNELSPLIRALKENQVTAIFTALAMTSTGHSIPLICHNGMNMLEILVQCHRYLAVLALLEHIFPLFIESPGSLFVSEKFDSIVLSLMAADRTFFKFAMSLISSNFPGLILKQFGDLIEVHLKNYRRYNLKSPAPLAEMWLRVLAKSWLTEPVASSYLMDKILSVAFFAPDMRATAIGVLHELLEKIIAVTQNESQNASNKQRFSLLNWVTGSNPFGTLMNKTSSDTPWFSLFAIEVEQQVLFRKTSLWDNLLVDLSSSSGKTSVDASLKKCCATLKLSNIPSSTLPIYRWSQQVLETPVDHPTIPIFWQKFFHLFLARVPLPNHKDVGSVGLKFFEGSTNNSLMMKLKKKLQDCKEFYETKCKNVSTIVPQERRTWYCNVVNLYTCYVLWLEDPSLHDPNVNMYTLSTAYCTERLTTIFQGNETPWMEFIDREALRLHQRQTLQSWQQCLRRNVEIPSKPIFSPKEEDPLVRIEKRLAKYESPVQPPPLKPQPVLVTDLPPEVLYNKHHTMEYLKDPFKALNSYAQLYWLRSGELTSVDVSMLELAPQLYHTVETPVTLHAACDTHTPGASRQQSINSLTCAGPAVIHLKVNEVHVDNSVDMLIHNNRLEAQNLIKRCVQQPNQAVCIGSIQVQEVVKVLEEKSDELRRIGDVQLLSSLQDVGVTLFYRLTNYYNEKTIAYPPMKQLITSCVETLGQCFICADERQGPVLLAQVLENPSLTSLLSVHFSPAASTPQTFILLYRTLMNAISASNADLIFVLLTKFDVGAWLVSQKPRLSDRSQLLEIVTDALAASGQDPAQEFIMIHEVLRRQLCVIMMSDCSQHLPQMLELLLKHSESHSLSLDVWFDVVNALVWHTGVQFKPHCAMAQVVTSMATFAVQQTLLSLNEIRSIIGVLAKFFTDERHQYGLYGLYPKYRAYVSAFTVLLGVLSHALVAAIVKKSKSEAVNVCAEIWPTYLSLFSPWICPYMTQDLTQPMAAWIQQLTDDRSILPPWITADSGHAHKITAVFTETLRFLLDILPGNRDIYGYVWQFYVANYAHTTVKDHILSVINDNLLSLNWTRFNPSINDLELMLRMSDTYVPSCHSFMGALFIDIPWNSIIENQSSSLAQHSAKTHAILLHLLIKLSIEPNVRQSGKIIELLRASKSFHWETVDSANYESVVNWFVMSYDPRVVLSMELEGDNINQAVMELLRYAAGLAHSLPGYHASTPRKRQAFVRAYVKLIMTCLSKHKTIATSQQSKVEAAIEDILILINTVIPQTGGNYAEAGLLIAEVLTLVNLTSGPSSRICTDTLVSWISKRGDCIVSAALLRTVGTSVEPVASIGEILEAVLEAIFNDQGGSDWTSTLNHLHEPVPRNVPVWNHLAENGQLLTLYALVSKKFASTLDVSEKLGILSSLVALIATLPPIADKSEKIIPLLHLCLVLTSQLGEPAPIVCEKNLKALVQSAEAWAEFKPSWGFLGAIGIKRQQPLSNRMKAVCRVFCALVLMQLPTVKNNELFKDSIPVIRTSPQSAGGFSSNSTELGPSSEAHKALANLEICTNDKAFSDVRQALEISLGFIRRTENSLHNAHQLLLRVAAMLFPDIRYIQALPIQAIFKNAAVPSDL